MNFRDDLKHDLDSLKQKDQFRQLREISSQGSQAVFNDKPMLNLSSNDYLGLSTRKELLEEFYHPLGGGGQIQDYALSASSSRLLTGNHRAYTELENDLGSLYGEQALVFNSGYHANVGILPALAAKGDIILSDKLNHASIIDGVRLSQAQFKRYRHLDYDNLEKLLVESQQTYKRIFIITESVFSMDGDLADLKKLVELKKRYDAVLIVDEAHSVGVFGEKGLGLCAQQGVIDDIDIIVGTFGKAYCSCGAFAVMDSVIRDYLINSMRSLIFTTALPPAVVNWSRFVLNKTLRMSAQRDNLQRLSARLRKGFSDKGYPTAGGSQIVPLLVGDNADTIKLADKMQDAGLLVFAIRPPTVPAGTSRLRFSLNAELGESDIDKILNVL